jgi:signal transduction histidine kinase/ActR/RegA family two-component response regulator
VFPELKDTELATALDRVFEMGEPVSAKETRVLLDRSGCGVLEECFFMFNLEPLRAPDDGVVGVMAIAVDVSELVHARRVLEQSNVERTKLLCDLQAASQAKDEFLAMLGHELRNPLSPIVTALQLMKMRGDLKSSKEQAIIQRQVDHLIRLVDDLLDVSRITQGKVELRSESVEVAQVLAKAVEMASMLFEQRHHHLDIDVAAGLQWRGDSTRLAQVVANLLTNAARYTEPGGKVLLRAAQEADRIVISVKDNGKGLSKELLPRVFELFFQGHQGIDRAAGGLGIGLALVRNLVELHGGSVQALSDGPGCGSEFIVRLPISATDAGSANLGSDAGVVAGRVQHRILVVDDNLDAADLIGTLLRAVGHEVQVANDPLQALAVADAFMPEIALLDIGLPVMDGYELAARLRETAGPNCRLIALTGYGQESDRKRSMAAGFETHLVKPIDIDLLKRLLDRPAREPLH